MSFQGVTINKVRGGLVRATDTSDRTVLLVCGATAIPSKLPDYTAVKLNSIEALEQLTWTEGTDTKNKELLYYHASEVFRLSPERDLWVMVVPKTKKVSELALEDEFINGIRAIDGVNTIGVAGLTADEDLPTAINAMQLLVEDLLEGLGTYLTDASSAEDLRALEAENISVIVAQDYDVAQSQTEYNNYAAVGSALGMLSVRYVHENMGSVDIESHPRTAKGTADYSMLDKTLGRWVNPALSNGTLMTSVSKSDQKNLNEKGYIYASSFQGYAGVFFSNSHTCVAKDTDYAYIEYNAVWNKAAKLVRNTLIPRVRSRVDADPSTGYIASETIAYWSSLVRQALDTMTNANDVSDFDVYIDSSQAAVSDKPFEVQIKLVANGIVHEFSVDLGFTNKID